MKGRRFTALLLAMVLVLNVLSLPVFAANEEDDSNSNNVTTPVEEWEYIPGQYASDHASTVLSDGDSTESSADIVEVHVTATDCTTNETVTVGGADVNLYVGSQLIRSTPDDDGDGIVEVSLAGLTIEQRQNATISANKIVSRGKAMNGTARDTLFQNFPKDEDGEYYRYTMELHSETIDDGGNWLGAKIPASKESNKVDIVFIIDGTGSMSDEINNVRTNIASFAENLIASGLDIRFCIIEYRDITCSEETIVHEVSGSHWLTNIDAVVGELSSIKATGGGDGPETVLDPLGYVADNSLMNWRSDAYRFSFVLTDANYKTNNNYGYSSMSEVTAQLAEMDVVTSVITSSSYQSTYSELYETTGGIYANINSSTFENEMLALSESIIDSVTREMTLKLSEPRLLVNMSVCYFADDETSQSEAYKESVKTMLNEYSHRLAETTDGHVMIDKILLFSTNDRLNFYDTSNIASMADIRIETTEGESITIHSNAEANGFYTSKVNNADVGESFPQFNSLPDNLRIRASFWNIQLSGTEGAGWNNSMIDEAYQYSTTVTHETGHYLMGFFDEYMNANAETWRNVGGKPYSAFGLMDNQHDDIEMSKNSIDYAYTSTNSTFTYHWNVFGKSCEATLADLLTTGNTSYDNSKNRFTRYDSSTGTYKTSRFYYYELPSGGVFDNTGNDAEYGQYTIRYSFASNSDRTAGYSYAELSDDDFLSTSSASSESTTVAAAPTEAVTIASTFTQDSVAAVDFVSSEDTVTVSIAAEEGFTYSVSVLKSGDEGHTAVALTDNTAELPIAKGELAEVRVTATDGETAQYNTYYIDRSEDTSAGYIYTSADNAVMAYVATDEESSYTFVADNTGYTNGAYRSMNQATWISSDNGVGFDSGEIYSVANYLAEIDYTTLSWFRFAAGEWIALATDYSEEESMNIGARADLDGEGLYVLMAKAAPEGEVLPARNLTYTQSTDRDAVVTITFEDPNPNSKYYNVYYSETEFTDRYEEGVVVRSFRADSTELTINLLERGRTVYAGVEIVLEDGCRSELSEIILVGGEADSDGDGIPDWYCNKYLLWGKDGEEKDIANSDDDGDGLTNLEEYLGGSDPTNPNDPVHTTNVAVESVSVSASELALCVDETVKVTATVLPENASNKAVTWTSADPDIAVVEAFGATCQITAVAVGETQIYVVTADGGYSAEITIKVTAIPFGTYGDSLTWKLSNEGILTISGTGAMPDYDSSADIPWKSYRSRIKTVVIEDGITSIGQFAFYNCKNLSDITIPDGVTDIGSYAFYHCSGLTECALPDSVVNIQSSAFECCDHLSGITIPNGVAAIKAYAFRDCASLTSMTLPASLTDLGAYAFRDCTNLSSITFEGDAPRFGTQAFRGLTAVVSYPADNGTWTVDVMQNYGGTITWVATGDTSAVIASGYSGYTTWSLTENGILTFDGNGAMKNYTGKSAMPWYDYMDQIREIVIQDGVTSIGNYAFYGLTNLKSVRIAASVTSIGDYAFKGCTALNGVTLPEALTGLGESVFYGCTSLTAIEIPASLYTVKPYAFKNCTALAKLTLHEGNLMKLSDGAFYGTALTEITIPACLNVIDSYCFKNCANLKSIVLTEGNLTEIREAVFYGTAISSITIPEGVTKIGSYAFKNCTKLTSIDLPGTLQTVGEASFYACTALEVLELPDSVTTIGNYAFRNCTGLNSVNFGSGLTTIGESSFYGSSKLTSLAIPEGVTSIGSYAFKSCTGLTDVSLPGTLTTIGESAFYGCIGLTEINIPANVTSVGAYAFSRCTGLKTITFTGDAPVIGDGAFSKVIATVYYPADNATWTSDMKLNYGGTLTWTEA